MTAGSIWAEMYKIKGYLFQIERYTDRKRHNNRVGTFIIVGLTLIGAVSAFFPDYNLITIISAISVAATTIVKEFIPLFTQPESDLCELDRIHMYYEKYLSSMEFLYNQWLNKQIDEKKLGIEFEKLKNTRDDRETTLNRLCRKMKQEERDYIKDETKKYFNIAFPDNE